MATDMSTASLIAAAIENIDKVGPCSARFHLTAVEDIRAIKRKVIAERAKEIMKEWASRTASESENILKEVTASTRPSRIISYGKDNLPAGPGVYLSKDLYLVEGRADVNNLLRSGIDNVIAIEGTRVPDSVIKLAKDKNVTAFLDGDRGGDLIQKELAQVIKTKKVLRAPAGKEVEDLTPIEILKILKPTETAEKTEVTKPEAAKPPTAAKRPSPPKIAQPLLTKIKEIHPKINGTLEAVILDEKMKRILQVPVNQLVVSLTSQKNAKAVIFDGIVTQRLIDLCENLKAGTIVGHRVGNITRKPVGISILTFADLGLD